jgi:hypothetical protein
MKAFYVLLFFLSANAFGAWEKLPYGYGFDNAGTDTFIDRAQIKRDHSVVTFPLFTNSYDQKKGAKSELYVFLFDCKYPTIVTLKQSFYDKHWLRGGKTLEINDPYDFKGVLFLEKLWEQLCRRSLPNTQYSQPQKNQQDAIRDQIRLNQKLIRQIEREIEMDMLKDDIVDEIELRRRLR